MVLSNSTYLFAKHCNGVSGVTKKQQDLQWFSICKAVNAVGVCDRSIEDVKEKWRNMTKKAKAEFTSQRISMMKTGGGSPPPMMDSMSVDIIESLKDTASFSGIPGAGDSETLVLNISGKFAFKPFLSIYVKPGEYLCQIK